ncbi:MAG: DUF4880 domain-containing protein [bacterium]|nr:DUF4880 domain-containing protein [bacterium]
MSRRLDSAEKWLAHLLRGEVTEGDLRALDAWCAESPGNRAELDLLHRGWQLSGDLADDPDLATSTLLDTAAAGPRRDGWRRGLLAAAAVAAVVTAGLWAFWSQDPVLEHRTVQGEQRLVALTDGSKIRLNTATTLNVAANGREVVLLEGEAFFDVRSRQEGHFSVDAGAGRVRVLGTRFNVLRQGDDVSISVLEGRVAIDTSVATEADSYRLDAGQTLEIRGTEEPRLVEGGSALARVRAWQEGKIEFDHTPLHEAVRELSRYTPEALSIAEPSLRELRVSGVFRIDRLADLRSVRFALENTLPVTIRSTGGTLELVPAGG